MKNAPALLLLLFLSLTATRACAQWSIGAGGGIAYRSQARPFLSAQGAYQLNNRLSATLSLSSNIPYQYHRSGFHASSPRQLSTGDTASYSWDSRTRATAASALLGVRGLLKPQGSPLNWYVSLSAGYGLEYKHTHGRTTYTYGGEVDRYNDRRVGNYMLGSIGAGAIWQLNKIDLLAGVSGTGWFRPFGGDTSRGSFRAPQYRPALEVMAQWHLGH